MKRHDILIIGGGPAGYSGALEGARMGASVGLIEEGFLGGTCLNRGCIPTKALLHSAYLLNLINGGKRYGIEVKGLSLSLEAAVKNKNRTVTGLRKGLTKTLENAGIEIYGGKAALVSSDRVNVMTQGLTEDVGAENILLATGSTNKIIPIEGLKGDKIIFSDRFMDMDTVPERSCIIGGGAVGVEMACILRAFGSNVTIIEMMTDILPGEDRGTTQELSRALKVKGIRIMTSSRVREVSEVESGLRLTIDGGSGEVAVEVDRIFMAVGRTPNVEGLGPEGIGIRFTEGAIDVDKNMRTNIDGIWAAGDCTGGYMLAHVASEEGRVAVRNIMNISEKIDLGQVPRCVYSHPQAAFVGRGEEELKDKGAAFKVGRASFASSGRAACIGETRGGVKVIISEDGEELLGMTIIGKEACELIMEGVISMKNRVSPLYVLRSIHPHPTLSETIQEAFHNALG